MGKIVKIKRLAIAFFYDEHGIVDDYMTHLMRSFNPFVEKTIFVSNGPLSKTSEIAVQKVVDTIVIRENVGFDAWAYKEVLERVGFEELKKYDEVLLYNHTFYGPIFPFSEMFSEMEKRECAFWGITSHQSMQPNPFTGKGVLPFHINSHFIAVRNELLQSLAFQNYWQTLSKIENYTDSIMKHEALFTKHFSDLGYKFSTYLDIKKYGSHYPPMLELDETLLHRSPIIKRRIFFGDTAYLEENAADVARAIDILRQNSKYDEELIWRNVMRAGKLRTINVNATLMSILPDMATTKKITQNKFGKIAVCAHVYYTEMLDELLDKSDSIPVPYDFIATTDTDEKVKFIKKVAAKRQRIKKIIVRKLPQNRGRDMSALFIACRDLFVSDQYDLVCRIHTKKSPQVEAARGNLFKRHLIENILGNEGYVTNLLELLTKRPWIGLAMPPLVHISYWTIGHSWYNNKDRARVVASELNLKVDFDSDTPVAPNGTMFWFRPKALRKLFEHEWKWEDFNAEPNHVDGGLAHVLERLIAYVAQDAQYTTEHVMNTRLAAQNYTFLEYKLDKLVSKLPLSNLNYQVHILEGWKNSGYPVTNYLQNGFTPDGHAKVGSWLHRFRVSLYPASNMIKDPIKNFFKRRKSIER
jgi:lipopolysaccharide biosynthesis protein